MVPQKPFKEAQQTKQVLRATTMQWFSIFKLPYKRSLIGENMESQH